MQNKFYKITGIFLLLLSLISIIDRLWIYLIRSEGIKSSSLQQISSLWKTILSFAPVLLPYSYYILPLVLLSGIYYSIIGFKNKAVNKVIFASAIVQLISLPSIVLAILLGALPCAYGRGDGLCMLFGAPFVFLDYILWIGGFIVLSIGIVMQKRNQ